MDVDKPEVIADAKVEDGFDASLADSSASGLGLFNSLVVGLWVGSWVG